METLGGLWSAGASALAVLTGRSANVDDDSRLSRDPSDVSTASGDEDEHAHSLEDAVPSTPSGDLHEDWMMVVEDRASVARAVPMGDVHAQRIRNRPGLTRLWDGVDAADLLIERPLVGVGRAVALTYAAAAASGLPWATPATTVAASATTEPELDSDRSPAYIRVGRVYDTTQASASRRGDLVDWIDFCKGDRVTRRYLSRQQRFKAPAAVKNYPTKLHKQRHIKTHG